MSGLHRKVLRPERFGQRARPGWFVPVCLGAAALAFYGIARISVMIVDEPARGLKVLGVFVVLSVAFCLKATWFLRRAQTPAAVQKTPRLASMGAGGVKRMSARTVGGVLAAVLQALGRTGHAGRAGEVRKPADVIPLKRNREGP